MDSLIFEWDDNKEKLNIKKHGIDFVTASRIFLDPDRIEYFDEAHSSEEEERYITIGLVEDVLYVSYTVRTPNIRIISARIANNREREVYYNGY